MEISEVGHRLRTVRLRQGLTIAEVATRCGVSTGFVSTVENGRSDLSIGRLTKILEVYGMRVTDFLEPVTDEGRTTADLDAYRGRPMVTSPSEGITYTHLPRLQHGAMTAIEVSLETGAALRNWSQHAGDEFVYVVSGRVLFAVGESEVDLASGGSHYFRGRTRHRFANLSADRSVFVAVMSDPRMGRVVAGMQLEAVQGGGEED